MKSCLEFSGLLSAWGQAAVFNKAGEQIGELQRSFISLWTDHAKAMGYEPDGMVFETPRGRARIFKCSDGGYNWEAI